MEIIRENYYYDGNYYNINIYTEMLDENSSEEEINDFINEYLYSIYG